MMKTTKLLKRFEKVSTLDPNTGEVNYYKYPTLKEGDYGYHKVWVPLLCDYALKTGNKQTQIMFYLMEHMNRENVVKSKQEDIANAVGATIKTARECLKELTNTSNGRIPFMVRIGESEYRINPDVIFTGSFKSRSALTSKFYAEVKKAQKTKGKKQCAL